jgi:hypothetical protein
MTMIVPAGKAAKFARISMATIICAGKKVTKRQ